MLGRTIENGMRASADNPDQELFWLSFALNYQKAIAAGFLDLSPETLIGTPNFRFYPEKLSAVIRGEKIQFSPNEFKILLFLFMCDQPQTPSEISKGINTHKADDYPINIRVHISGIRRKLEENSLDPQIIKTIHAKKGTKGYYWLNTGAI